MKNKIIFKWLLVLLLGSVTPTCLKAQNTDFVKGLSGLPYTNPGTLQVRYYLDFSVKIDVPGNNPYCYGFPRNTFETGTDSTGWLDFQTISLSSTTSYNGRPFTNLLPDIRVDSYWTRDFNLTDLSNGNYSGPPTLNFPNYTSYIRALESNSVGTMAAGNFYFIPSSGNYVVNGCESIKVESRFFNVIAQFRKKPTAQDPNPPLEPYYCNGGGPFPQIAGGYSTGGGSSSGGGGSGGSSGGGTIRNLCSCGPPADRWLDVPDFPPTCTKVPLKVNGTTPVLFVDHPAGEASEILKGNITPGSKTDTGLKEVNFGDRKSVV